MGPFNQLSHHNGVNGLAESMTAHQQSQAFDNTAVPPGEMMIQSQDIDMSALVGGDMMPWLEYLPYDMFGMYDQQDEGMGEDERGPPP